MARFRSTQLAVALASLLDLACVLVLAWWGFASFALPWPGVLAGLGAPLLAVLLWALFLSPRAMLRIDRFGQALIEIVIATAAGLALLELGQPWAAALLVLSATVIGVTGGRRTSER